MSPSPRILTSRPQLERGRLHYAGHDADNLKVRGRLAFAGLALVIVFAVGTAGYYALGAGQWSLDSCAYMVLITITSSFDAILLEEHVGPGTHIACMGTDTRGKQEVATALVARASLFTDEVAQAVSIGECQHAVAEGRVRESDITQIGAVINATHPGRVSDDEVTLFDGTGVGLQDLAVASAVVDLALARGTAIEVEF